MKRLIIIATLILIVGVVVVAIYSYVTSYRDISINHTNVTDVTVVNQDTGDVVAEGVDSGSIVKIKKDGLHSVNYTGTEGYGSGSIAIGESTRNITIDPDFSDERNTELATELTPTIKKLLDEAYPLHSDYFNLTDITLRDKGTWMKAILSYKAGYNFNSDDLLVLLKNTDGTWDLVGEPTIVFTTKKYSDTPREILVWANRR